MTIDESKRRWSRWGPPAILIVALVVGAVLLARVMGLFPGLAADDAETLQMQRARLVDRMSNELRLGPEQVARVREVIDASPILGQGNPSLTIHPMTRGECWNARALASELAEASPACRKPNMVALFDRERGESADDAELCIDQFEFPNLPCEYPVVHVRAREAALLCKAVGKRLCDAHEWEGACAGSVRPAEREYAWGRARSEMMRLHNQSRERVWAYGEAPDRNMCAMGSSKTAGCGGGYRRCGSNTYPSGAFPKCVSSFGVYDQHGNAAEHMNLPLRPDELARHGRLGHTEMKGSWFIFASFQAHEDDCRWRAKD